MGQKSTRRAAPRTARATTTDPAAALESGSGADVPVVAGREPCPCGSGRRYKACHGRHAGQAAEAFVRRPFEGLAGECDLVAMREIVPAATAVLALREGRTVTLATVLPMAWPGLVRQDGEIFIGLQVPGGSGDASRDVAHAIELALAAEPGTPIAPTALPGSGPRLQDLVGEQGPRSAGAGSAGAGSVGAGLAVTVHQGFDFWLEGVEERTPEVVASMERANEAVVPTERLTSVEAAYWCRIRERAHLRWVVPFDDEALLDGLARLHARDADSLGAGSRYIGSFRAHGLVVPVWDLAPETTAESLEEPLDAFAGRLAEAMADTSAPSDDVRRAKAGLRSRQVTLR